jgi:hypothetical protein
MTETEFKIWLQGYIDLSDETYLDHPQLTIIHNHAQLVIATAGQTSLLMQDILLSLEILKNKLHDVSREDILIFYTKVCCQLHS